MKKFLIALFVLVSIHLSAQTDGISYQAVIIGPDNQELPGVDAEGNILPDATVSIRFTILNENNQVEYQEVQTTNTDQYGRINLLIGQENPDGFAEISWDGTNKDLNVEIDFNGGSDFVDMSREKLTFLPYAFHRNITATGTLTVDDLTFLNGELQVEGPANLNSTLNVYGGNATNLSGDLMVEGLTNLNNDLEVTGTTVLGSTLNVNNATHLSGTLVVDSLATFNNGINVVGPSSFDDLLIRNDLTVINTSTFFNRANVNGQTVINAQGYNGETNDPPLELIESKLFPLVIKGQNQGIAIMVNGVPNNGSNSDLDIPISKDNVYISFLDQGSGTSYGSIQGQSIVDLENEDFYTIERAIRVWDLAYAYIGNFKSGWQLGNAIGDLTASSTSTTACVGLGACVTVPIPSLIIVDIIKLVFAIADAVQSLVTTFNAANKLIEYEAFRYDGLGVTYTSGAGDYAEWLPKQNGTDKFVAGELVGIKNGMVTTNITEADKIMVVSTHPFILGNMPDSGQEENNVKIAFMGQVPVRVIGSVNPGDYILPTEFGSGFGVAINPKDMQTKDYKRMVGVAWNVIAEVADGLSLVNVAVGLNSNDMSDLIYKQEKEIKELRKTSNNLQLQIDKSNAILSNLMPGFAEAIGKSTNSQFKSLEEDKIEIYNHNDEEEFYLHSEVNDILYFEFSNEQIENIIELARENYLQLLNENDERNKLLLGGEDFSLNDNLQNKYLIEIKDHFFWQKIDTDPEYKKEIINFIKTEMDKIVHTHNKYAHLFTDFKVRKN